MIDNLNEPIRRKERDLKRDFFRRPRGSGILPGGIKKCRPWPACLILSITLLLASPATVPWADGGSPSAGALKCRTAITQKYVAMDEIRERLSLEYIREHYHLTLDKPHIKPRIIVLHWTAIEDFDRSYNCMHPSTLSEQRNDIATAGNLNVCAHFLVDRDGTIVQLLPLPYLARHVIGLNYYAIGIENVGSDTLPMTDKQAASNAAIIRCLLDRYPDIRYVIGHYEYLQIEDTPLFLEADTAYRTKKIDPGKDFMQKVRHEVRDLYKKGRLEDINTINKKRSPPSPSQ